MHSCAQLDFNCNRAQIKITLQEPYSSLGCQYVHHDCQIKKLWCGQNIYTSRFSKSYISTIPACKLTLFICASNFFPATIVNNFKSMSYASLQKKSVLQTPRPRNFKLLPLWQTTTLEISCDKYFKKVRLKMVVHSFTFSWWEVEPKTFYNIKHG